MQSEPGGDWEKDSRWIKRYRFDIFVIVVVTAMATVGVFTAFSVYGWVGGALALGMALFLLFALLYIAPEV